MANTFYLIQTATVTAAGGAATIEFTNIPQTYTDLKVLLSLRNTNTSVLADVRFNGVSTNLSGRMLAGAGTSASGYGFTTEIRTYGGTNPSDYTASIFSNFEIYIPNYTSSSNKSVSLDFASENNATASWSGVASGLWSSSSAITQVSVVVSGGNVAQYSSASLYGISKN